MELKLNNLWYYNPWFTIGLSKGHGTNGTLLHRPKSKSNSYFRVKRNLGPKRGGKQGELIGTCTCFKCIPKGWLVVAANVGSHDPARVF